MRKISVADYFVEFLIANGVTDIFGYQGGMIAYIFDSLGKPQYRDKISYHSCGNEQGAAIAACSYAQTSGKLGVAISTSGPGFTNMLTGIANAWFDSIPVLYVSGNVNTKDKKRSSGFRQNGFQEIQAAPMAAPVTKLSEEIELTTNYVECFNNAIEVAMTDRRGPVYLDLPINVCREFVEFETIEPFNMPAIEKYNAEPYLAELNKYEKPVIIAGAGIKQADCLEDFREMVNLLGIPVITTMPAIDLLPSDSPYMMGYIGGTARREAGIVLQNADFVLSLGTRLCSKQVGHNMALFAPKAKKFIRVDIDETEFERKLKPDEFEVKANLRSFMNSAVAFARTYKKQHKQWSMHCTEMHDLLKEVDMTEANQMCREITAMLPNMSNLIFDVGKNLTYATQSSIIKDNSHVLFSAGLGTMGYSIPAAIGAHYGNHKLSYVITGDGGAQMNIQELNTIAKNSIPAKIFVLNNKALGNIRIFQENYLDSHFVATGEKEGDYFSCDFVAIAKAFGLKGIKLNSVYELKNHSDLLFNNDAVLFEIEYEDCPALPGIVAGGEFLKRNTGISNEIIERINYLMS